MSRLHKEGYIAHTVRKSIMKTHHWLPRVLAAVAYIASVNAAYAVTYVVLPLIGDQLTIVGARTVMGSNMDRNEHQVEHLDDSVLDTAASKFVDAAIARAQPSAAVVTLRANDSKIYALRDKLTEADPAAIEELVNLLQGKMENLPSARLVLIAPYWAEQELKTARNYVGTGKVAGLGFYIDRVTRTRRVDTLESAIGFLGAFANFRIAVIDVSSKKVLAQQVIATGRVYSAARSSDTHPWNALSAEAKLRALASLMQVEIARMVPAVLQETP